MPGKSAHNRKKQSLQSKKKKNRRSPLGVVVQQQHDVQIDKPVTPPRVVAPTVTAPVLLQHLYVFTELRRISILAGIILVILVALVLLLT